MSNLREIIECEKVILKRITLEEAQERVDVYQENKKNLKGYIFWYKEDYNLDDEYSYQEYVKEAWDKNKEYIYSIFSKESQEYLGTAGIIVKDAKLKIYEIGYWISEKVRSKGITTDIVNNITDMLNKEVNPARIEIIVSPADNPPSYKVAHKAGYAFEAKVFNQLMMDGELINSLYFVKITDENKQREIESLEPKLKELYNLEY